MSPTPWVCGWVDCRSCGLVDEDGVDPTMDETEEVVIEDEDEADFDVHDDAGEGKEDDKCMMQARRRAGSRSLTR